MVMEESRASRSDDSLCPELLWRRVPPDPMTTCAPPPYFYDDVSSQLL